MKIGLWDYIRAAFNARPVGMLVPPNWVGVGAFAVLGLVNPGFWVIGGGLEMAYLLGLAHSARFQRFVSGSRSVEARKQFESQMRMQVMQLTPPDQQRYLGLERRCQAIIEQQRGQAGPGGVSADLQAQAESL